MHHPRLRVPYATLCWQYRGSRWFTRASFHDFFRCLEWMPSDSREGNDQEKLFFSLPAEPRTYFALYLSVLKMLQHFTLLWCSPYAKSGYFCSQIQSMLFIVIIFLIHLSIVIKLSLTIFYSILIMYLHFFTIFLVLPNCLRNITCHLN